VACEGAASAVVSTACRTVSAWLYALCCAAPFNDTLGCPACIAMHRHSTGGAFSAAPLPLHWQNIDTPPFLQPTQETCNCYCPSSRPCLPFYSLYSVLLLRLLSLLLSCSHLLLAPFLWLLPAKCYLLVAYTCRSVVAAQIL
jgi:hypothetical protein